VNEIELPLIQRIQEFKIPLEHPYATRIECRTGTNRELLTIYVWPTVEKDSQWHTYGLLYWLDMDNIRISTVQRQISEGRGEFFAGIFGKIDMVEREIALGIYKDPKIMPSADTAMTRKDKENGD
jgi:hypothetical protein